MRIETFFIIFGLHAAKFRHSQDEKLHLYSFYLVTGWCDTVRGLRLRVGCECVQVD